MWRAPKFITALESYVNAPGLNKIIVIDNDYRRRPKHPVLQNARIELINYGKNIYVNPAWNEGYYRSKTTVFGIINDDITVNPDLFKDISQLDFTNIDLIGVHLQGTPDNYNIAAHANPKDELFKLNVNKNEAIGGQSYAFGVCMFVKHTSYSVIPSLFQIWFGDDYLVQRCENIYCLKTSRIQGEISKTLVALENTTEINSRIVLDCINASTHGHLKNSKNWDLVRQTVDRSRMRYESKKKNIFTEEYRQALKTPSDINQNLSILHELAQECKHITEMGVRTGVSTRAFLNTEAELISYDIQLNDTVSKLFAQAKQQGKKVSYVQADVLSIDIAPTDLLFIDTLHTYTQLSAELARHADKVKKYIAFHDTYTFGLRGEDGKDNRGLLTAIIEFVINNPAWRFKTFRTNNNGMTVLERVKE